MKLTKFRVAVALLLIVAIVHFSAADPFVILCKKDCRITREDCIDAAYRAYTRCKRYSEEAQCRDDFNRQVDICWVEYDDCIQTCG